MTGKRMTYLVVLCVVILVGYLGWKMTSRNAYESAAYQILVSDGAFEVREYPDLMLVATPMNPGSDGNDGSFGRLFRYISGGNEQAQKVAMTTPVFMDPQSTPTEGEMAFVLPDSVAQSSIPEPSGASVAIRKRLAGQFAVLRFAGRPDAEIRKKRETELRQWLAGTGRTGDATAEYAGYDPPWTPGFLRRNEVLIRLTPGPEAR